MSGLVDQFQEYSSWRFAVSQAIKRYRDWLAQAQLIDSSGQARIARTLNRLADDKLSIAFVAEFSRGKSELINAIFFADYGQRILPSSAGRTTMCPTELMYDDMMPPSIRLLPIETREIEGSTADFKAKPQEWQVLPLDTSSGDGMLDAFKRVAETKRVSVEEAGRYGLYHENDPDQITSVAADGTLEISRWRHAIINFPHPLLEQGLVILDTPGLNAIGTEPELTINLIPNAHAVLFILAADTGVTKSDIEIWRNHIGGARKQGRIVVLNKIDSMWDELKTPPQIESEIDRQVESCANILGLDKDQLFPVSAQKGLVGKVTRDAKLLEKSRLPALEEALSKELLPARQEIVREDVRTEVGEITRISRGLLLTRGRDVVEQLVELKSLRGKNKTMVEHMMGRVKNEKDEFDRALMKIQATRAVFTRLTNDVFTILGLDALRTQVLATRQRMVGKTILGPIFSSVLVKAVREFFENVRNNFKIAERKLAEITDMLTVMFGKFAVEHGMGVSAPIPLSLHRYMKELDRIESAYQRNFGMRSIVTNPDVVLAQRFFETIASRVKDTHELANRDLEAWIKAVMAPLEGQAREHQQQLRRRLESIKRIHSAGDSLEERIREVATAHDSLESQQASLDEMTQLIEATLEAELARQPDLVL
jgi:hypothetical protein